MTGTEERPAVWIGHVSMKSHRLGETRDFLVSLGLRPIAQGEGFAVLELRGGTHLVVLPCDGPLSGSAPFDLMVDDLEATHRRFQEIGLSPSRISAGRIHRSFTVTDPSGQNVTFNSSHVSDRPV